MKDEKIVCIDIGNSCVKTACFDADRIIARASCSAEQICSLIETLNPADIVWVSSVNTAAFEKLSNEAKKKNIVLHRVSGAENLPFINSYDNPGKLGEDRMCNAAAASLYYGQRHKIIVDCGSAINVEVVVDGNHFVGGVIAPGVEMMLRSLSADTSLLELAPAHIPQSVIGKNTADNISSGVCYGIIGLISHICRTIEVERHCGFARIITGGSAHMLFPYLDGFIFDRDLTLKGIAGIARLNGRK